MIKFHRSIVIRVCCLAAAGLLVFSLCGCTPPDTSPESDTEAPTSAEAPGSAETPETTAAPASADPSDATEAPAADGTTVTAPAEQTDPPQTDVIPDSDPLAFDNEADWRAFLTGAWDYVPAGESEPALTVTLAEDGGFTVKKGDALFSGTWELGRLFAEEGDLPDWLTFELSQQYGNISSFGDFTVGLRSVVDGAVAALWAQVNNGDSFFSYYFDDFSPVLTKQGAAPQSYAPRRCGERFYAVCWRVSDDVSAFDTPNDTAVAALLLDDAADASGQTANFWCSLSYPVSENAALRCPLAELRPGCVVEVETDGTGAVVMLNWANER